MTLEVDAHYREKWADNCIIRFQNRGFVLKGTTQPPVRIEGTKFHFLLTDNVAASKFTKGDTVPVVNPNDDTVEIQTQEWDAAVHLYDFDRTRISYNEEDRRQQQLTMALGRTADEIIYDEIMSVTLPASQIIGDGSTGMDPYMLLKGVEKMVDNDVVLDHGIYGPLPSMSFNQLKTKKLFANADWQGGDLPLTKMRGVQHKTFDAVHCFYLPPHLRKKYTSGGTTRFRIWVADCVGAGHNEEMRTEWERQATKKRWFINHTMDGAAKVLQPTGIIEFQVDANSTIEQEVELTKAVA